MPCVPATIRLLVFASAFALSGCGEDDPTAPRIENTTFASSLGVNLAASTRNPSGLYWRDILVGAGAVADTGAVVSVRYSGAFVNGTVFDEGTLAPPNAVEIGAGDAIAGFEEGIVGMRVGGKRQLIIPPHLGYGARPFFTIPANSILVFTIELLSVS